MRRDEMDDLSAEMRQEEHAARVRDYGAADAATYDGRVAEGAAMLARDASLTPPERMPCEAELEKLVGEAEAGWKVYPPSSGSRAAPAAIVEHPPVEGERKPAIPPPEKQHPNPGRRRGW